nr:cytochrome c oxidase subunit 2 [Andricus mairei]UZI00098.1 cytochrome c oxidase subunit 2 [Andricus mairei]UZN92489.1 cytochrome c oxidase subunit 2 [Andricus mairei]UZN92515.1 cytochrome c oxidase subunit 2 [Andricus mairei]
MMNTWLNLNLQDSSSPLMEWLIKFHDYTLMINLMTTFIIIYMMMMILFNNFINLNIENQMIEIVWTLFPIYVLILMSIPSLKILYLSDEMYSPIMSIKSVGHQWYWSYEIPDFKNVNFESFMLSDFDNLDSFRLLDVDNRLVLPMNLQIRMLVSSDDVIHSFTIPSMGIKVDGMPGRINQLNLFINRPGVFFGQCSEICGANHSFMPIVIESTNLKMFLNWINSI